MNFFETRIKKTIKITRYLWEYFHNYFVTIICMLLVFIYYLYCIFSRYYIDMDVCIGNLIKADYATLDSYSVRSISSKSIVKFGSINYNIENKNYKEAIELIDGIKNLLGERSILSKYLTIRQALLMINVINSKDEYIDYLKKHYLLLGNDSINTLISAYELCNEY